MKIGLHSSGRYYTTLTVNGEKKFIYGASEKEVEDQYIEMKSKIKQGYNVVDNPTMEDYAVKWYRLKKGGKLELATLEMYRNAINVHIGPALGEIKIKDITSSDIQGLLNSITSSDSLAHKVKITLNQIFKLAINDRLIAFNPVEGCIKVAPDDPKRDFYDDIQRELLLQILKGHRIYNLVYFILNTGTRMGEALALNYNDINDKEKTIDITKAVAYDNSKPYIKTPKNKKRGSRTIPMMNDLASFIGELKASSNSVLLFPGHDGKQLGKSEMNRIKRSANKKIKRWFKQAGKKDETKHLLEYQFKLNFRPLRHTFCTALYDAGIDEVSAAEIMGHDVEIMREIYTHISDLRREKTKVLLNDIYRNKTALL